jgi:hypothetical protein
MIFLLIFIGINGCSNKETETQDSVINTEDSMSYLRGLEGEWIATLEGDNSQYGFEYTLSARDNVIIERLRTDIPTEMLTVYNVEHNILKASHFCQLQNQPKLIAVNSGEGDINLLCTGEVGNTSSHDEFHMHGYHILKTDTGYKVWMDMYKDGEIMMNNRYELFRIDSERGQELTNLKEKN